MPLVKTFGLFLIITLLESLDYFVHANTTYLSTSYYFIIECFHVIGSTV